MINVKFEKDIKEILSEEYVKKCLNDNNFGPIYDFIIAMYNYPANSSLVEDLTEILLSIVDIDFLLKHIGNKLPIYCLDERQDIESLKIPKNITDIPVGSFYNMSNLKKIYIHKGVKHIGGGVFSYLFRNRTHIFYEGSREELENIASRGFYSDGFSNNDTGLITFDVTEEFFESTGVI